jgi:hypothetical protein
VASGPVASGSASHSQGIPKRIRIGVAGAVCISLLLVLGLGALAGGFALVSAPDGSGMGFDVELLAGSPFADYLVPGLVLGGLFGVGSITAAGLGLRRSGLAPPLAFTIGSAQMFWIVVELLIIREFSFLHPTMFLIGLGIAATAAVWGRPIVDAWRARG